MGFRFRFPNKRALLGVDNSPNALIFPLSSIPIPSSFLTETPIQGAQMQCWESINTVPRPTSFFSLVLFSEPITVRGLSSDKGCHTPKVHLQHIPSRNRI